MKGKIGTSSATRKDLLELLELSVGKYNTLIQTAEGCITILTIYMAKCGDKSGDFPDTFETIFQRRVSCLSEFEAENYRNQYNEISGRHN
ncbi:MAG: hypothetical protein WC548_02480 [Candidatus Pacearchaeota archaeon]